MDRVAAAASNTLPAGVRRARERRQYNAVAPQEAAEQEEAPSPERAAVTQSPEAEKATENIENDPNAFHVTILDFAQSKFNVTVLPSFTIGQLARAGAAIHKVPPHRQRLIFRGKMLNEEAVSLEELGITDEGVIVHLFPKPRVVITDGSNTTNETEAENEEGGGARVPTIVMDSHEAERRAEILVLGSVEFAEAQNNVKLFSFILLIISSMKLLGLLALAMHEEDATEEQQGYMTDDMYHHGNGHHQHPPYYNNTGHNSTHLAPTDPQDFLRHWGTTQYFDTAISILGVYVGLIGIKASTENTLRTARRYLLGLVLTGLAWMTYNFFVEVKVDRNKEEAHPSHSNSEDDPYAQAFQASLFPLMIWILCWVRAWNFHRLLHEAEAEASERIQSQLDLEEEGEANVEGGGVLT